MLSVMMLEFFNISKVGLLITLFLVVHPSYLRLLKYCAQLQQWDAWLLVSVMWACRLVTRRAGFIGYL
jgi:hypothetical protein